jgi:hypothetical protein
MRRSRCSDNSFACGIAFAGNQIPWRATHASVADRENVADRKQFFALAERHVSVAAGDVSNLTRALFVHHAHFFFVHLYIRAPGWRPPAGPRAFVLQAHARRDAKPRKGHCRAGNVTASHHIHHPN